jgi:hypothetical protein
VRQESTAALATVLLLVGCSSGSGDGTGVERETAPVAAATTSTFTWSDLAVEGRRQGLTDRVPRSVRRICSDIAARAAEQGSSQPVFCPPLVPDGPVRVELAGGIARYRRFDDGYNIGFWNPAVEEAREFGGHWSIAAGAAKSLRVYSHPPPPLAPAGEPRPQPVRPASAKTTLRGVPVTVYRMAPKSRGFYAGHIVFEWRHGETTFHLTMHGHRRESHESQTRIMAAALIEQVKACATEEQRRDHSETCALVFGRGSIE